MAIIARWRMPPEKRCGYSSKLRTGAGNPTSPSSSSAQVQAKLLDDLLADRHRRVE
jgi:hypothetical protein